MFWVAGLCYFGSCLTHNLGITAHFSLWYRSYSAQTTPKGVPARSSVQCFMNMSKAWQPSIKYMSALFLHLQKRSSNYGIYVLTLHELVSIPCHFGIEVGTFLAGNVDPCMYVQQGECNVFVSVFLSILLGKHFKQVSYTFYRCS